MTNDPKVLDLVKRMLKLTTRSNMTIAQVYEAHAQCILGLAVEASGGDRAKAARLIRESMEDLAARIEDPRTVWREVVREGEVVKPS